MYLYIVIIPVVFLLFFLQKGNPVTKESGCIVLYSMYFFFEIVFVLEVTLFQIIYFCDQILYFCVDNFDPTLSDCHCLLQIKFSANCATRNDLLSDICKTTYVESHFIWSEGSGCSSKK